MNNSPPPLSHAYPTSIPQQPSQEGIFRLELSCSLDSALEEQEMMSRRLNAVRSEISGIPSFHEQHSFLPSTPQHLLRSSPDLRGYTPLHYASALGKEETTTLLLEDSHVQIDAREPREGLTPLMYAVISSQARLVQSLVEQGANPNLKDFHGRTPLYLATMNRERDMVVFLVENGADPNLADLEGVTPLHIAAALGDMEIVGALIHRGSWLDAKDNSEETPLFWAIREGKGHVVKCLVESGADLSLCNSDGESVVEFCRSIGDDGGEMARFLSIHASQAMQTRNRSNSARLVRTPENAAYVCPLQQQNVNPGAERMITHSFERMTLEKARSSSAPEPVRSCSAPSAPVLDQNVLRNWVVW